MKADPANTDWQDDLASSYREVGDALLDQGSLADALASYRDGLAIADRLAKSNPGNAEWQRRAAISLPESWLRAGCAGRSRCRA